MCDSVEGKAGVGPFLLRGLVCLFGFGVVVGAEEGVALRFGYGTEIERRFAVLDAGFLIECAFEAVCGLLRFALRLLQGGEEFEVREREIAGDGMVHGVARVVFGGAAAVHGWWRFVGLVRFGVGVEQLLHG